MTKDFKPFDWAVLGCISTFAILCVLHICFGMTNVIAVLSSPNTASWVQAIGAIAAIGIAIWVSNRSERTAARTAATAALRFIEMAEAAVGGLYVSTSVSHEEAMVQRARFVGELKEVQLIGQSIQLGHLSPELCSLVLQGRTQMGRCVDLTSEIAKYPQIFVNPEDGLSSYPRDGYTIAQALIKASWDTTKELSTKAKAL